jgi:hypothetical protein
LEKEFQMSSLCAIRKWGTGTFFFLFTNLCSGAVGKFCNRQNIYPNRILYSKIKMK